MNTFAEELNAEAFAHFVDRLVMAYVDAYRVDAERRRKKRIARRRRSRRTS